MDSFRRKLHCQLERVPWEQSYSNELPWGLGNAVWWAILVGERKNSKGWTHTHTCWFNNILPSIFPSTFCLQVCWELVSASLAARSNWKKTLYSIYLRWKRTACSVHVGRHGTVLILALNFISDGIQALKDLNSCFQVRPKAPDFGSILFSGVGSSPEDSISKIDPRNQQHLYYITD